MIRGDYQRSPFPATCLARARLVTCGDRQRHSPLEYDAGTRFCEGRGLLGVPRADELP